LAVNSLASNMDMVRAEIIPQLNSIPYPTGALLLRHIACRYTTRTQGYSIQLASQFKSPSRQSISISFATLLQT
jgi:hypothetical protein